VDNFDKIIEQLKVTACGVKNQCTTNATALLILQDSPLVYEADSYWRGGVTR
jgi:hypothetical protein